jgi:hypothetical protein
VWLRHLQLWFQHAQDWFLHAECDVETYECDYDFHESDHDQSVISTRRVWFLHVECNLYTQSVISTRKRVIFSRRVCFWKPKHDWVKRARCNVVKKRSAIFFYFLTIKILVQIRPCVSGRCEVLFMNEFCVVSHALSRIFSHSHKNKTNNKKTLNSPPWSMAILTEYLGPLFKILCN